MRPCAMVALIGTAGLLAGPGCGGVSHADGDADGDADADGEPPVFAPNCDRDASLVYYDDTDAYNAELRALCDGFDGAAPGPGYQHFPDLECRTTYDGGFEICAGMRPIAAFRDFCDRIDGDPRCYSSIWFVCIPPPSPELESSYCRCMLWDAASCDVIDQHDGQTCSDASECGPFPCEAGLCAITRCESDDDCGELWCGSYTAAPHGYCLTEPGDA